MTYKNTIRSDEFEQGSDQNTAKITAGNAGKEHTSCDSDTKGGDKKVTEGSTQSSLDLFTVAPRKSGNATKVVASQDADRIDELAKSIDKILKTVSTKPCTDDDLDGATLPTATVVSGGDAANLEDFISANLDLSISEKDGLKFLTCNVCAAYLSTPSCVREKTQ